jgi:hypothetical protein
LQKSPTGNPIIRNHLASSYIFSELSASSKDRGNAHANRAQKRRRSFEAVNKRLSPLLPISVLSSTKRERAIASHALFLPHVQDVSIGADIATAEVCSSKKFALVHGNAAVIALSPMLA